MVTDEQVVSAVEVIGKILNRTSEKILGIGEPPAHTCPDIDKLIRAIDSAYRLASKAERDCGKYSECGHESQFSDVAWELDGLEDGLEELRAANDALRCWGQEWKDKAKELLNKYEPNWKNE